METTLCSVVLYCDEEDEEVVSAFREEHGLALYCDLRLAQNIVRVAKEEKPAASTRNLIDAIDYYFDHFPLEI